MAANVVGNDFFRHASVAHGNDIVGGYRSHRDGPAEPSFDFSSVLSFDVVERAAHCGAADGPDARANRSAGSGAADSIPYQGAKASSREATKQCTLI